jgi:hypothetical protein
VRFAYGAVRKLQEYKEELEKQTNSSPTNSIIPVESISISPVESISIIPVESIDEDEITHDELAGIQSLRRHLKGMNSE